MLDDILMAGRPYFRVGKQIIKVDREYRYRIGPSNFLLAFGAYLGHPTMNYLYNAKIFLSDSDIRKCIHRDTQHLDDLLNNLGRYKVQAEKLAEMIVAEKALLKHPAMRYPVIVIGLAKGTPQDAIDHFEMLGYDELKL